MLPDHLKMSPLGELELIPVRALEVKDLYAEVLRLVSLIPEGRRTTYGLIAESLGDVIASRAVGEVLSRNPRPGKPPMGVPCHRVLYADGSIGRYSFGVELKRELLLKEGVKLEGYKAVGEPRKPPHVGILKERAKEQERIRKEAEGVCSREKKEFRGRVLALDSSYIRARLYDVAIAVAAIVEVPGCILKGAYYAIDTAVVPYIPTYLAYREYPLMVPLAKELLPEVDLIAVNGHGLAHPRAGIATHIGYLLRFPSVGLAKKLLKGTKAVHVGRRYVSPGYESYAYTNLGCAIETADRITKVLRKRLVEGNSQEARRKRFLWRLPMRRP